MNYGSKIEQFARRAADIDAKLAELAAKRREYAYGAADNNAAALKAIDALDQKADALKRERTTLLDASEQAERLQREAEAEAAAQDRKRREAQARKIVVAVSDLNRDIDAAMSAMQKLFERRRDLLSELAQTKIVAPNLLLRQHQKFLPTAAARKVGLEHFMALEHVPPGSVAPLADTNRALAAFTAPNGAQEEDAA